MRDLPRAAALHRAGSQPAPPADIGIDAFQAERSPARGYRTAPLAGLWTHGKGGYYHDGRFPTLEAVVDHYDGALGLGLDGGAEERLVQFLKSL